jgi:hypothetical protein
MAGITQATNEQAASSDETVRAIEDVQVRTKEVKAAAAASAQVTRALAVDAKALAQRTGDVGRAATRNVAEMAALFPVHEAEPS